MTPRRHVRIAAGALLLLSALSVPSGAARLTTGAGEPEGLQSGGPATAAEVKALLSSRRFGDAEPLARQLLARAEATQGPEGDQTGLALNLLVTALVGERRVAAETDALAERALAVNEKRLGPSSPRVSESLRNLAVIRGHQGRYLEAHRLATRAYLIQKDAFAADSPDLANTINLLAIMRTNVGDYAGARDLFEQHVAWCEKTHGTDHVETAGALNNLGNLYWTMGNNAAARPVLERAIAIYERTGKADDPTVGNALNNLALVYGNSGNPEEAERLHLRALAIREKAYGPDHVLVAQTLTNLGFVQKSLGRYDDAVRSYQRALAINEKALGPNHPAVATVLQNLSINMANAGDFDGALRLLRRAIAINEENIGANHPALTAPLFSLAAMHTNMRNWQAAADVALRAEQIRRDHVRLTARAMSEREALSYATTNPSALNLAIALAEQQPSVSRRAVWDAVVRSRALVLDELAARQRAIASSSDPEVSALVRQVADTRDRLARLVMRAGDTSGTSPGPNEDLVRLGTELERAERDLASKTAYRAAHPDPGLDDVLAALPADTALVAFSRFRRAELRRETDDGRPAGLVPSYVAFVAGPASHELALVPIGPASEVDAAVAAWRDGVAEHGEVVGIGERRREAAYRDTSASLRQLVWDGLVPHLQGAARVLIVPDGTLHLLNFGALPADDGKYLVETGPLVAYLSAERDLVRKVDATPGDGLLALGAPAFDERAASGQRVAKQIWAFRGQRSECDVFDSLRFESLPASGAEAEKVAALWGAEGGGKATVDVLRGPAASEDAFKARAPGRRVVHLATHAFLLDARCPSVLDQGTRGGSREMGENPLLLSGLVFAGANNRATSGADEEDGILTAEEVAAMDLSSVEWAVLSGCDTGVGRLRAGEGVMGLRRAFQIAGARTVITSLWPVDDATTLTWMTRLYAGRFKERLSTPAAVRSASLGILRARRAAGGSTHPYYWAGFVAVGDLR